jgi:putative transposase
VVQLCANGKTVANRTMPVASCAHALTEYRYDVLKGDIQIRRRELIIRICDAEDVRILKGFVSKDHVHMLIDYQPKTSLSDLVKRLKGRMSLIVQQEFTQLQKWYWAIGYGAWSTGNIMEQAVIELPLLLRPPSDPL